MATKPTDTTYTVITGKAYWASLVTPNTKFEPVWQIDVSLDAENRKKVEKDGLKVKNNGDDRGDFISIKRRTTKKDGSARNAPRVVDAHLNPWNDTLIGNGSTVRVKYAAYDYPIPGLRKMGRSADLVKVQILKLVPYAGKADLDFTVEEDGYVVGQPTAAAANF